MNQCPSCSSFNDAGAAYCNQCGRPLARGGRHGLPRAPRLAVLVACAALVGLSAVLVLYLRLNQPEAAARRPLPLARHAPGPAPEETVAEEALPAAEPAGPQAISPEAARRLTDQAAAALELYDDSDQPLREAPAVVLDGGNVISRLRPLLGAYRGSCRVGRARDQVREVLGIIAYDPYRDLALLELRAGGELAGLPVAGGDDASAMAAGTDVLVASTGRAALTRIAEYPYFTPDGTSHARLPDDSPLPVGALVALDVYGSLVGLVLLPAGREAAGGAPQGPEARPPALVDPLLALASQQGRPAGLSLADATSRLYEGTFAGLLFRGRRAAQARNLAGAVELLVQALDQAVREGTADEETAEALSLLRGAIDGVLEERRRTRDIRGAVSFLAIAAQRFPSERRYWLDLAAARLELSEEREAIAALSEARRLEPGSDVDALLQRSYLEGSARDLSLGRIQVAAEWLEKGLEVLPGSARLRLELARIYQRWGLYDDAVRVYQEARSLDPGMAPEIDSALERIEETIRRREAVILQIPPGSTTIQANVVVNGAATFRFIIDTGATFTSISQQMADALGYQISANVERVVVGTANGVIMAPMVILESVNLEGYVVRNVKAIVLPQRGQSEVGLLGLNFLDHFRYSVDAGRREFKLERR